MQQQPQTDASVSSTIGLPAAVAWPGLSAFLNVVSNHQHYTDTIIFSNAPVNDIEDALDWAGSYDDAGFTLLFHDSNTKEAILRLPSLSQYTATEVFDSHLLQLIEARGLDYEHVRSLERTETWSTDERFRAQPDTSFYPTHRIGAVNEFPTLMVEVGETQSHANLRRVMRGWFKMSNGLLKIVIVVDIRRSQSGNHEIVFEKWRCPDGRLAYDTEISVQLRQDFQHPANDTPCIYKADNFTVTTTPESQPLPMVIEIDLLCDRAPRPEEKDILVSDFVFRDIASQVWGDL